GGCGGFGPPPPRYGVDGFGGPPMGLAGGWPGADPGPWGPPGYGGFGGFFGNPGRWKGFDPLDSIRWQLHANDQRWNQIGPSVAQYVLAQRNMLGNNGLDSPVTSAMLGLWQTRSDP